MIEVTASATLFMAGALAVCSERGGPLFAFLSVLLVVVAGILLGGQVQE